MTIFGGSSFFTRSHKEDFLYAIKKLLMLRAPVGCVSKHAPPRCSQFSDSLFRRGDGTGPAEPLAVYIHWPFCRSKCPYCDFNSHVRASVDGSRWAKALLADLDHQADLTTGRVVGSVFFGGGTP